MISYLWDYFLVPDHRIPILLGFILRLSMEFLIFHYTYAIILISAQMLSFGLAGYTYADVLPERNSSSKLPHIYENGADSSNLKIS